MPRTADAADMLKCSFCQKSQRQVKKLITGSGVYICNECVELCNEIIEEELGAEASNFSLDSLPKPQEIAAFLDEYVVGQAAAERTWSVAVYNHYKRVRAEQLPKGSEDSVEIGKSNILLLGPTGTGKTYLAQSLARMLDVPFTIADATALTEAGYVGEDVENILLKLIQAADDDVKRAEVGIIYIDEIDKISRNQRTPPSLVMSQVRACSKRCSRSLKEPLLPYLRRVDASIHNRTLSRSIPRTSCSSVQGRLRVWKRSLLLARVGAVSVLARICTMSILRQPFSTRSRQMICIGSVSSQNL